MFTVPLTLVQVTSLGAGSIPRSSRSVRACLSYDLDPCSCLMRSLTEIITGGGSRPVLIWTVFAISPSFEFAARRVGNSGVIIERAETPLRHSLSSFPALSLCPFLSLAVTG